MQQCNNVFLHAHAITSLACGVICCLSPAVGEDTPVWKNSIGMQFIPIPSGEFTMGPGKDCNDTPQRKVKITRPYYLSVYEVTQAEFKQVMGFNPSWYAYKGDHRPVECVNWFDAVEFCQRLSKKKGRPIAC